MRLEPNHRKQLILNAALHSAEFHGYQFITREIVAKGAEVSPALVSHYYLTIGLLRTAVMTEAVKVGRVPVIAQGIVARCPVAMGASDELKEQVVQWMRGV